jgi:hypothetical protein
LIENLHLLLLIILDFFLYMDAFMNLIEECLENYLLDPSPNISERLIKDVLIASNSSSSGF